MLLGSKPWSNAMEILSEKDGMDTELLVYAMTLINKVGCETMHSLFRNMKNSTLHALLSAYWPLFPHIPVIQTLAGLPDQDSFYDVVDSLEEQAIEALAQRQINRKGADLDLVEQFNIYEVSHSILFEV